MQTRKCPFFLLATLILLCAACGEDSAVLDAPGGKPTPLDESTRSTLAYAGSRVEGNYVELQGDAHSLYIVPQGAPEMLFGDQGDYSGDIANRIFVSDTQPTTIMTTLRTRTNVACTVVELGSPNKVINVAERPWSTELSDAKHRCLGMSADAQRILVMSFTETTNEHDERTISTQQLEIWDRTDGTFHKTQEHAYDPRFDAQLSSNGRYVMLGYDDNAIAIWDLNTTLEQIIATQVLTDNARMSRNGDHIIFLSTDASLDESPCGQEPGYKLFMWHRSDSSFQCISKHPDGRNFRLASDSYGANIIPLDVSNDARYALFLGRYTDLNLDPREARRQGLFVYDLLDNTISGVFPTALDPNVSAYDFSLSPSPDEARVYARVVPFDNVLNTCSLILETCHQGGPPTVVSAAYTNAEFAEFPDELNPVTIVSAAP